ncbi:folate-binding protein [Herbiconiux sp. CPCC 205716]|uniref:Folate-binding protein n=1 Tax=Herbiconiux gentiana TaxID=2970912 RepID=A0ABT2GET5_9MICO|nr:folate-binding protein [Herbiconiux gentiana]MCS5714734.1 folate-binding protein [Herbiconiux gentiana]
MAGRSAFLDLPGAVAGTDPDPGVPAHYGNPVSEQRMLAAGRAIVDLSSRGVISVEGPDRLSWLDSVTSQSLKGLSPASSAETLLLSANGRIEHAIRLFDDGVTAWLLVDAAETAPLEAWLQRMRFMLRVEIADRSEEFATVGRLAARAGDPVPPALAAVAAAPSGVVLDWADPWPEIVAGGVQYASVDEHPGATWFWHETLVPRVSLPALADAVRRGEVGAAGVLAAEALRIVAWRPRLSTEVDDRSIPHELDWMRSAVHLAKGCYRGQETVAKVHNLGHPPRRLVQLQLDGSDAVLPAAGDPVLLAADAALPADAAPEPLGLVTSVGNHHEWGPVALAVLRRQAPEGEPLVVRTEAGDVAASADTIVGPDAGAAVGRVRLPRLGARTR